MNDWLIHIIVPMIVSNVLHMVIVKKNYFSFLSIPVAEKAFGQNKTWRGFIILPLLNGAALFCLNLFTSFLDNGYAFVTGVVLGVVYMTFELPNSWIKRKLGVASGASSEKRWLFTLMDKTDSSLGISLAAMVMFGFGVWEALQLFLIAGLTHFIFSYLLVLAGIKKSL